ncbi:MAG: GNAT family N-acetyltransferase, partial [Actinomycetes bacterium]
ATFVAWAPDPGGGPEVAVGYCSLFEYTSEANTAYVGTLSAHPAWHGQGFGRDLLKAALERSVALGYDRLDLNTWAGNLKAVPLYKKSGYFWVPDTTVKMENYLPLIFRLQAAQDFFSHVDWYRDFQRDLSLREDDEKAGKLGVYTYLWERDGRRLKVVIDRKAKGVVALETGRYNISVAIDDPKLPIGLQRRVTWHVENHDASPLSVSILAEGEDSVRCTFQGSGRVEGAQDWTAQATAEQPEGAPPRGRPANRVRSTVVVDGAAVPLVIGTQVVQPVEVTFDAKRRWLTPHVPKRMWVTVENNLETRVSGTVRLSAPSGVELDRHTLELDLEESGRASWPLTLAGRLRGTHALRAQATLRAAPLEGEGPVVRGSSNGRVPPTSADLRTRVFAQSLFCGEPGEVFVQQDELRVVLSTDRLLVSIPLQPDGWWMPLFTVSDRETERQILRHTVTVGPPFVPSIFTRSTWRAHVEREGAAVTIVLSTTPQVMPDLTFERIIRVSPSGLLKLGFRATNTGDAPMALTVSSGTSVELDMVRASQVAVPLQTGLVVEDSSRFPDWNEPDVTRPERYAEQWMAEFGKGWVGATIWQSAQTVEASWEAPGLSLDLGTIPSGGQAETPPVYLYAGQGDWRTARALWRQLVAPDAPAEDPQPRPAHSAVLERTVFDQSPAETRLRLTSERTRWLSGRVRLEVEGETIAESRVEELDVRRPQEAPVRVALPGEARAFPAAIVLDHERSTERTETALILAGAGASATPVTVSPEQDGEQELVRVDNGRFRLTLAPAKLGRVVNLSLRSAGGEWVNQLHASYPDQGVFVWLNPWFGGIHPTLRGGDRSWGYPGLLAQETFTWERAERTGTQGNHWQGVTVSTETTKGHKGLGVACSYLTLAGSNVLAALVRVENRSAARFAGSVSLTTFLAPSGDRTRSTLHYLRFGERTQKRVHGGSWMSSEQWCAVESPEGPVIAVVAASPGLRVDPGDMGNEGVHPSTTHSLDVAPGQSLETVTYLVLAENIDQARLYRHLSEVGGLA